MSSLRPVGRSAATLHKDRASLCRFTFADGRQCRTPRSPHHPHFCSDHARKESQACAADKLGSDLAYFFSGQYLSACDLSAALGRLIVGVARGDIKPRSARTLAYLSQTLIQTIHLAQHEYINALGSDSWRKAVCNSIHQNFDYRNASPPQPPPQSPTPTSLESTLIEMPASVDSKSLTGTLSPLDATLMKKQGEGAPTRAEIDRKSPPLGMKN
jgi:hypothetical protein